jgi:hypothetical protein
MVGMDFEIRITFAGITGLAVASPKFLGVVIGRENDPDWVLHVISLYFIGAVVGLVVLGAIELVVGFLTVRKDRRVDASIRALTAGTGMDVEAFEDLSYHTAYVIQMHPGLTTEQLIARPSMQPRVGALDRAEAERLLQFAGAYFRTASRFGLSADGTWLPTYRNRSVWRTVRQHARALNHGKLSPLASPVAA